MSGERYVDETCMSSWPKTTSCGVREWVHPFPPIYFLHQDSKKKTWCVIQRNWDLAATKQFKTKTGAINSFIRERSKFLIKEYRELLKRK